jgi:hypothetical protein
MDSREKAKRDMLICQTLEALVEAELARHPPAARHRRAREYLSGEKVATIDPDTAKLEALRDQLHWAEGGLREELESERCTADDEALCL